MSDQPKNPCLNFEKNANVRNRWLGYCRSYLSSFRTALRAGNERARSEAIDVLVVGLKMRVDLRCLNVGVTEPPADLVEADASYGELGSEGVAKDMWCDPFEASPFQHGLEGAFELVTVSMPAGSLSPWDE